MERHWKVAIPVILAVLVATILGACVPAPPAEEVVAPPVEEEPPPAVVEEEAPAPEEELTVYVVVHGGIAHPFWRVVEKGAADADALYPDLKVIYSGPEEYDLEEFVSLVEAAIAAKPNGLIVTITSHEALDEPLRRAIEGGLPVIAINAMDPRPEAERIPYLTYIGEDHYMMGALVAKKMLAMMRENGVEPEGAVYGNHHPGAFHIEQRAAGFVDTVKAEGIPAEQIDVTEDPVKGAEVLVAYLKANPDTNMVQPAGTPHSEAFIPRAIEEGYTPGNDLFVATIDLSPKVLEYIEDGTMLFATDQQQYLQGYLSVVHMYLHLKYGFVPPPAPISTGEAAATKDLVPMIRDLVEKGYK
ncbi:simple sugar transport system substrate-binding protein [Candidatus Hakubella thermalkaliphila]|nr:simple sugar transport system substrate-binding protein [Candidatus Hakubella thermalkaliphila]